MFRRPRGGSRGARGVMDDLRVVVGLFLKCCRFAFAGASGRISFMSSACGIFFIVHRLCRQLCYPFCVFGGLVSSKSLIFLWGNRNFCM